MSLTMGTGPFGPQRNGTFNFDTSVLTSNTLYFEDCPKRVRTMFAGTTIADSRRVMTMHETGHLPVYYFPRDDVHMDLLQKTNHSTHCPFKGDATYWSVRIDDRAAENAGWGYETPLEDAPALADYLAFDPDQMDAWFEEDEQVIGHPHDPYHRVDVLQGSRHTRVTLDGDVIAESDRPKLLFETSLPVRYYLPPEDVRTDLLTPVATVTVCPYKGRASHWSVGAVADAVWGYPEPLPEATSVQGYFCFDDAKVNVEIDGQRQG